jgi:hypothetical protein
VDWHHRRLRVRAALPGYRIVRNGLSSSGLGDMILDAQVALVGAPDEALTAGLVFAAMLPVGDDSKDLGMGHPMLMPGMWAAWKDDRIFVQGQVAYGWMIGQGHRHGGGPVPIVNPMNAREVALGGSAGFLFHPRARARGGAYGAVPVNNQSGAARAAAFVGGDVLLDWLDLGLEGHLPFVGDPFSAKALVTLGARF